MSLVIPPGFGQAVYRFALAGDPEECLTTIGFPMAGYDDGQDAADNLAGDFRLAVGVGVILLGWSFIGVRVYVGQDGGPPTVFESATIAHVGTNAGPALPPNCAFLIQKRSAAAGRRNRGRMFIPAGVGVGEDSVPVTGVMAEAQRAALEVRYTDWLDAAPKVILHDSATPGGATPTAIVNYIVQARLATVRRRLRP